MRDVLVIILGGGQGTRLYPLTHRRSKPAVPIGTKYRLIDVPISNCLHVGLRRIFVLTQFNSASLNRHVALAYRLDQFSRGFVEILAAEQTPENQDWFQGTADAVRRGLRHFAEMEATHYLILAGDHLYRMDFGEMIDRHIAQGADITIAAQPVLTADAPGMGIFRFDRDGQITDFEEKPGPERLAQIGASVPSSATFLTPDPQRPFVASMGIYVFSRRALLEALEQHDAVDFGREVIPASLGRYRVRPYIFDGYWADVGTIDSFYEANIAVTRPNAAFRFFDVVRPIYTNTRYLPGSRVDGCTFDQSAIGEGCDIERSRVRNSIIGIRSQVRAGSEISRSVLLGADYYEETHADRDGVPPLGVGRDVVLDRVIVDKNARIGDGARLVNAQGLTHADGEGWCIRNGIVVVPKNAAVAPGTVV
jgi:glucose-1-phosphate adenylyltransferase